jgi:hypothetical protein
MLTLDEIKAAAREGTEEALSNHKCFCNLIGEGITPATHVMHHQAFKKFQKDLTTIKVGFLLACFAAIPLVGWDWVKHQIGWLITK